MHVTMSVQMCASVAECVCAHMCAGIDMHVQGPEHQTLRAPGLGWSRYPVGADTCGQRSQASVCAVHFVHVGLSIQADTDERWTYTGGRGEIPMLA